MIDVKEAVGKASTFLQVLIPNALKERLEEVELTEDEKYWLVTLSYLETMIETQRQYKSFKVDATSGEVQSMKIRSV